MPTAVVAQVWRGGHRQALLSRFLRTDGLGLVDLDISTAWAVGELCALTGVSDVVDGHVALHARRHDLTVVTSDPEDIRAFADVEVIPL